MCAYKFGAKRINFTKISHVTCREADMTIRVQLWGSRTPKIWEGKNVQNSAQFWTTSEFDREYIRNGLRH